MKDVFGANLFSKDSIFQVSRNSLFREVAAILDGMRCSSIRFCMWILQLDFSPTCFWIEWNEFFNQKTHTFDVLNWENFQELGMQSPPLPQVQVRLGHYRIILHYTWYCLCKIDNPKNPDPSTVAILRTQTPASYRFVHPSIGGSNDSYIGKFT